MATKLIGDGGEHNPGVWFKFNENDPDSGEVCVRLATPRKTREISKASGRQKIEYKGGQRYNYTETDEEKSSRLLWDYIIVDWRGLEDNDGNPIPCTPEKKYDLMMDNLLFFRFITNCVTRLNDEAEQDRERIEKN